VFRRRERVAPSMPTEKATGSGESVRAAKSLERNSLGSSNPGRGARDLQTASLTLEKEKKKTSGLTSQESGNLYSRGERRKVVLISLEKTLQTKARALFQKGADSLKRGRAFFSPGRKRDAGSGEEKVIVPMQWKGTSPAELKKLRNVAEPLRNQLE